MIEFEVAGHAYKARRMDAMTEEAVTRKLSPMLNLAVPALGALKDGEGNVDLGRLTQSGALSPAKLIEALTTTLSTMPDENAQFIIGSCLSVCERRQKVGETEAWVQVWNKSGKRPMLDDIRAPHMYMIAANVMGEALRDFMRALGFA